MEGKIYEFIKWWSSKNLNKKILQNYNQIYTNDIAYYTYSSDDNWCNMSTERCCYWICGNIDYDIFNDALSI